MDDGLGSFTNALFSEDPGPDSADHPNRDIGGHKVCSMNFMTEINKTQGDSLGAQPHPFNSY